MKIPEQPSYRDLPKVSIITPSYNQVQFLEETVQSVLSQDYPNIEYIIVDGGSKDGSVEIIQRYSDRLAWWVSEADQGQTDALNKGFAHVTGEILAWINSDDTYLPGAVSEAVTFLQQNPDVGMVYGDANLIDENGQFLGLFPASQTDYRRLMRGFVHIPQQSSFFRASLWRQVGPLDPTIYFAMDYDLWVRLAKISLLVYHPRLWANFRLQSQGKSVISDHRCFPDMLRIHQREGGKWFSWLRLKAFSRRVFYTWLPLPVRIKLRKFLPF
jgi:glycosyltransferase involved in cell wall biosynthesis